MAGTAAGGDADAVLGDAVISWGAFHLTSEKYVAGMLATAAAAQVTLDDYSLHGWHSRRGRCRRHAWSRVHFMGRLPCH